MCRYVHAPQVRIDFDGVPQLTLRCTLLCSLANCVASYLAPHAMSLVAFLFCFIHSWMAIIIGRSSVCFCLALIVVDEAPSVVSSLLLAESSATLADVWRGC